MTSHRESVAAFYDRRTRPNYFNSLLFEGSEYSNFGYWRTDTADPGKACENLIEELLRFMPEKTGTILDVACGKGATTRYLCKHFHPANVTGINISKEQLKRCEVNAPDCTFIEMDATDMDFEEASFDNVICVEAAFHFDTREKFLNEAYRVLKPSGQLVLADMLLPFDVSRQPLANAVHNLEEYRSVIERANFTNVEVVDATEPCIEGRKKQLRRAVQKKLPELAGRPMLVHYLMRMTELLEDRWAEQVYLLVGCTKPPMLARAGKRRRRG